MGLFTVYFLKNNKKKKEKQECKIHCNDRKRGDEDYTCVRHVVTYQMVWEGEKIDCGKKKLSCVCGFFDRGQGRGDLFQDIQKLK